MKELVYPAVLYKDQDTGEFTISIRELGIVTEGATVVDAYINVKEYLCAMIDCAIKFDCEIEAPRDYEAVYKENNKGKTKNIVLLVDALR